MAQKPAEIAVITRTYQGLEGLRVKAGTRFAIDKPQDGMKVISRARFMQLVNSRLARPVGEEDAGALPERARYATNPTQERVVDGEGTSVKLARNVRQGARAKARQDETPPPPKQIGQTGSRTGKEKPASSSQVAPASSSSTSESRGRRGTGSGSSSSTTPGR